jgi:hypothetical protein
MSWSIVPFGKYRGKTLPEIITQDLDWFCWILPKLNGRLGTEARELARKARAIKIPKRYGKNMEVEYRYEFDNGSELSRRFAALHSSKLKRGIADGQSDFRTSTWRGLFLGRSITNEQAAS